MIKLRAIALWEEKDDRTLGRKGRSRYVRQGTQIKVIIKITK